MVAAAGGEGKPGKKSLSHCGAGFKTDVLKHFSFSVMRNEKVEMVTDGQKSIHRQCRTVTKIHFRDLFAHNVAFSHQLFCTFL